MTFHTYRLPDSRCRVQIPSVRAKPVHGHTLHRRVPGNQLEIGKFSKQFRFIFFFLTDKTTQFYKLYKLIRRRITDVSLRFTITLTSHIIRLILKSAFEHNFNILKDYEQYADDTPPYRSAAV